VDPLETFSTANRTSCISTGVTKRRQGNGTSDRWVTTGQ